MLSKKTNPQQKLSLGVLQGDYIGDDFIKHTLKYISKPSYSYKKYVLLRLETWK